MTPALYPITGDQAAEKFRKRMYGIGKMTGIISWSNETGQTFTASFKYLAPGKIYVKFSNPRGKVIVSNGKKLWVYNSNSNICGIQDLYRGSSGGIASLTKGYMAIVSPQGSGYTLKLKSNDRSISQITLILDRSFFLKKGKFKYKSGGIMNFSLSNVSTKASVMKSLFNFNVPASSQVVNNPLNVR